MITTPNAKINIGLHITRKREDGFHELETIFYPVDNKKDKLEITFGQSGKTTFQLTNTTLHIEDHSNLCLKAYRLLQENYQLPPLDIRLSKNIPAGAGLGGGSSDAAFTLKMINELCHLHLSNAALKNYAARLGSDVPFFIDNVPAYATGRGEVLKPVSLHLSHKVITLITPDIFISTADAFDGVTPVESDVYLPDAITLPIEQWKEVIRNDFEETLFIKYPLLQEIKEKLYQLGAHYVSLSGSGSTIYAISDEVLPFFLFDTKKIIDKQNEIKNC